MSTKYISNAKPAIATLQPAAATDPTALASSRAAGKLRTLRVWGITVLVIPLILSLAAVIGLERVDRKIAQPTASATQHHETSIEVIRERSERRTKRVKTILTRPVASRASPQDREAAALGWFFRGMIIWCYAWPLVILAVWFFQGVGAFWRNYAIVRPSLEISLSTVKTETSDAPPPAKELEDNPAPSAIFRLPLFIYQFVLVCEIRPPKRQRANTSLPYPTIPES